MSRTPIRSATPAASPGAAGRKERLRRWRLVLALLAAVIAVDQVAKWWAWRHIPGASINPGGDFLTGPTIGRWYVNLVTGALLDLMDCGLVTTAAAVLARRRRPVSITVCGSLMVGGWASNLLDRLGMHYWTAPGSIRGAVDFIGISGHSWNLADLCIIGTTPLFLLVSASLASRPAIRATGPATPAKRDSRRARVPIVAAAGAALIPTVALGATHHGTLARPMHPSQLSPIHAREHLRQPFKAHKTRPRLSTRLALNFPALEEAPVRSCRAG
jgi:lipoprotein signal peptidase